MTPLNDALQRNGSGPDGGNEVGHGHDRGTRTRQKTCRRRGAVMSEMVLALPFFFLVLSLLLYLGHGVMRLHQSQIADRYQAWKEATSAPGFGAVNDNANQQLNRAFFSNKTATLTYQGDSWFPGDSLQSLQASVGGRSGDAGNIVQTLFPTLDTGRKVTLTTTYTEDNVIWQKLSTPYTHSHIRIGNEWKFANNWRQKADGTWMPASGGAQVDSTINQLYVKDLDDLLRPLTNSGSGQLATRMISLYSGTPGYVGPNFGQ